MSTVLLLIIVGYLTYRYFSGLNPPARYTVKQVEGGYTIVNDKGRCLQINAPRQVGTDSKGNYWWLRENRRFATVFVDMDAVRAQAAKLDLKVVEQSVYLETPSGLCLAKRAFYNWLKKEC